MKLFLKLSNATYVLTMFIFTISKINMYQADDMHRSNKGTAVRESYLYCIEVLIPPFKNPLYT